MTATHIAVLLDQSGSMQSIKADTIGGYNQFLVEQKSAALAEDTFTLTVFSTECMVRHRAIPVRDVPSLTPETYRPAGNTALLDAITETIHAIQQRVDVADRVLFVIITDGEENSSRTATKASVKALIERKTAEGNWTFAYMGANVDAFHEAGGIGIQAGQTLSYAGTPQGTQNAWGTLSSASASYRSSGTRRSTSFFAEPKDRS